jgi:S1-C subfamily serine protease
MRAGLRKGDAITQIDGVDIRGVGDFLLIAAKKNPGESLAVRFRRGGSYGTVTVRLASSRASPP